jgi:D-alanyl-D-alanine carboxypeptidase (penicillin-binding protein 5/6)
MGSDTRDTRNASAQSLLDWGFANYSVYSHPGGEAGNAVVIGGTEDTCSGVLTPYTILLPKGKQKDVAVEYILHEKVPAPVHSGDVIGSARFYLGEQLLSETPIVSEEEIPEIGFFELFGRMFGIYLLK